MKSNIIYVLLVIVVITIAVFLLKEGEELPVVTVLMNGQGFEPAIFTVKKSQSVEFKNVSDDAYLWPASDLHPSHDVYPEFDPLEPIAPGGSWTFSFKKPGVWKFHDHLKPNLRGVITVER